MRNDNKSLADVQPGGMVRLATVPYDRARDLIGDAYNAGTHGIGYSQQAMELHDAIIPAQPSQVAYHGYVDLKWLSGSVGEVAHRLSTYMPTGLAEWADRARDCRIAAQVLSELSAQAVDLGAVRALLQRRIEQWRSHLPADPGAPGTREIETKGEHDYNNDVRIYREGIAVMEEVLSKIDSQAVQP